VRVDDESAAPVLGHFDGVVGAAELAAPADGRALRLGSQGDNRKNYRKQSDDRAAS
jgi:hypothetical protein